ncbi:MAG: hypothetical protein RIR51_1376 [Bacteroidota bacterium]
MKKLIIFLTIILVACGGDKKQEEPPKIAVVISTLNNPWFVILAESAAENARNLGYEAKIFDSQNNPALESDHFENLISSGFDAILFNSTDADGSVTNVLKAKEAGVPVFCMDREINSNQAATSQILSDNYSGCVSIGIEFVKALNGKGNYVEIMGVAGDNNTYARSNGFHSVVDQYPDLHLLAQQPGDFDRNKSLNVMESLLQANQDIQAVFCGNDAMAMGAYQAIKSAGLLNKIKIFGFDGTEEVIQKIKEGEIQATGMQYPLIMAKTAAEYADKYIKGERNFPQYVPVAVDLINSKTAKHF